MGKSPNNIDKGTSTGKLFLLASNNLTDFSFVVWPTIAYSHLSLIQIFSKDA